VNSNFNGLTGVNSLCSLSSPKRPIFSCPSELNVRSLPVLDQFQTSLGTAMRMCATFNLSFSSTALYFLIYFAPKSLINSIINVGLSCIKNGIHLTFRSKITQKLSKLFIWNKDYKFDLFFNFSLYRPFFLVISWL